MTTTDAANSILVKASRLAWWHKRISEGLDLQRERIIERELTAPRIHLGPDTPSVTVLVDIPANDIDYYLIEVSRLHELAKATIELLKGREVPLALLQAMEAMDDALPKRRQMRNALTHPDSRGRLSNVAFFSDLVVLGPDGSVHKIIDPRSDRDHGIATRLAAEIAIALTSVRDAGQA